MQIFGIVFHSLIPLVASFLTLALFSYLMAIGRKEPGRVSYLFFLAFIFLWQITDFLLWNVSDQDLYLEMFRYKTFFWIPIGFLFFNFIWNMLRLKPNRTYYFYGFLTLFVSLLGAFTQFVVSSLREATLGFVPYVNIGYIMALMVVVIGVIWGEQLLYIKIKTIQNEIERKALSLMFYSNLVVLLLVIVSDVILPMILELDSPQLGGSLVSVLHVVAFVAITKYKLLNFSVVQSLENLMNHIDDGVIILNPKKEIDSVNHVAQKVLESLDLDKRQQFLNELIELRKNEIQIEIIPRKFKTLLVSSYPLFEQSQSLGFLIFFRDISQRKEYEEYLNETRKDSEKTHHIKSTFISNLREAFQRPLNKIQISAEKILIQNNAFLKEHAQIILYQSTQLLRLINQILDYSRVEAQKLTLDEKSFNFTLFCEELREAVRPVEKEMGLKLEMGIDPTIPSFLYGDEYRLHQVLSNLILERIRDAMASEISVWIEKTKEYEKHIELQVVIKDVGLVLSPQDIEDMFDLNHQLIRIQNEPSLGLGLAFTKQLLGFMGGRVEVQSDELRGTLFIVHLLCKFATQTKVSLDSPEIKTLKDQRRLLIVDDHFGTREYFSRRLESSQLICDMAADGAEALRMALRKKYDIIFLDINLPEINGLEVADKLKEDSENRNTPIIGMTANVITYFQLKDKSKNIRDFVLKPLSSQDILNIVLKWC